MLPLLGALEVNKLEVICDVVIIFTWRALDLTRKGILGSNGKLKEHIKGLKFDDDGCDFVEDKVVFGDDGFVIEVVSRKYPQELEVAVGDTVVNKSFVKDFSNYQNFIVSFSDDKVKLIFEDKAILDGMTCEDTKIQGRIFSNWGRMMHVGFEAWMCTFRWRALDRTRKGMLGSNGKLKEHSLETEVYASEDSVDPTYEVRDEPSEDKLDDISIDSTNNDEEYQSARCLCQRIGVLAICVRMLLGLEVQQDRVRPCISLVELSRREVVNAFVWSLVGVPQFRFYEWLNVSDEGQVVA
ncbi:hypothetical protein Scep_003983 [Stephania cephalantha]|uniref:Uncharacterized protein n=1 Tax=Stephania cephalantha TaxID=152367 RepID=A0AAP0KUD6_9MAGN